ncbi:hypothetical protein H4Q26_008500 [Puccinia striiformis f. sp. tritici PST-130]|nr:hypothetical protein H4Q26_008500 [Puccinia striiformis f. sp. tritici PST-130]
MTSDDQRLERIRELISVSLSIGLNTFSSPEIMIAIGGGGFSLQEFWLRTFLKDPSKKNIPSRSAIGLSLYEELGTSDEADGLPNTEEKVGKEVVRLDFTTLGRNPLLGKRILIVDEVDDTRTTLSYAVNELEKDVQNQLSKLSPPNRPSSRPPNSLSLSVLHNKDKPKAGSIPEHIKYFAGKTVGDHWIDPAAKQPFRPVKHHQVGSISPHNPSRAQKFDIPDQHIKRRYQVFVDQTEHLNVHLDFSTLPISPPPAMDHLTNNGHPMFSECPNALGLNSEFVPVGNSHLRDLVYFPG